jgi:hypothetical protein
MEPGCPRVEGPSERNFTTDGDGTQKRNNRKEQLPCDAALKVEQKRK